MNTTLGCVPVRVTEARRNAAITSLLNDEAKHICKRITTSFIALAGEMNEGSKLIGEGVTTVEL